MTQFPVGLKRALRSDGLILDEPLRKDSCADCSALIGRNVDIEVPYRRSDGTSPREIARHAGIAKGLQAEIAALGASGPILELGAANFQTSLHLAHAMPDAQITALEPSPESLPQTSEIDIRVGTLADVSFATPFAVVYANHVLEHIADPKEFLAQIATILAPDGHVLLSCPSGLVPSHELLFSDHLYHFTPTAMAAVATGSGLWLRDSKPTPWEPFSRLFHFTRTPVPDSAPPPTAVAALYAHRVRYLMQWSQADGRLCQAMSGSPILFGGGEFSQLIRAYLPKLWSRITCIIVDDLEGVRTFDKPVFRTSEVDLRGRDIVVGLHPMSSEAVTERLLGLGAASVLSPIGMPENDQCT
ncbi:class I SAM-dependent methyltransferase [Jannaschia faecimaris]|uniref:class I SAM-dependent methyltransferase n=1 Tax=Jannaschia faecimaris TaxID=1244108 RepID=UPI001481C4E9|nr:class I SAM-dependent methyltransferase [Jannaschia faecimaris]